MAHLVGDKNMSDSSPELNTNTTTRQNFLKSEETMESLGGWQSKLLSQGKKQLVRLRSVAI